MNDISNLIKNINHYVFYDNIDTDSIIMSNWDYTYLDKYNDVIKRIPINQSIMIEHRILNKSTVNYYGFTSPWYDSYKRQLLYVIGFNYDVFKRLFYIDKKECVNQFIITTIHELYHIELHQTGFDARDSMLFDINVSVMNSRYNRLSIVSNLNTYTELLIQSSIYQESIHV